jgi:hypothetical protein
MIWRRAILALGWAWALAFVTAAQEAGVYEIDLTDYQSGPIDSWLMSKGFVREGDAKGDGKIAFTADADGLKIDVLRRARGFLINKRINAGYSTVEIEWGVNRFPAGASYEKQVNNEAIMVQVFLGAKKFASGSMFVPDVPYFVGLFLCENDPIGRAFTGHYFTQSGRYVCLDSPDRGATVVSSYDLRAGSRTMFGPAVSGDVSGFAISADTTSSGNGRSTAFIRKIRFIP